MPSFLMSLKGLDRMFWRSESLPTQPTQDPALGEIGEAMRVQRALVS
jgi:hypothetical protein